MSELPFLLLVEAMVWCIETMIIGEYWEALHESVRTDSICIIPNQCANLAKLCGLWLKSRLKIQQKQHIGFLSRGGSGGCMTTNTTSTWFILLIGFQGSVGHKFGHFTIGCYAIGLRPNPLCRRGFIRSTVTGALQPFSKGWACTTSFALR